MSAFRKGIGSAAGAPTQSQYGVVQMRDIVESVAARKLRDRENAIVGSL
ncbi:MAG: hypothetical protein P8P84_01815 [Paracoccaceae bacterium]|nr:hypothetical protein [Paracoccaceae bacterium]